MGLSPRTRRNPNADHFRVMRFRSISADAEEPASRPRNTSPITVYPRGRGGTEPCAASITARHGLSPRTRRNRGNAHARGSGKGSISADAEEPRGSAAICRLGNVYLRGRGGTSPRASPTIRCAGLSPRTRRSPGQEPQYFQAWRSISADAEEPADTTRATRYSRVYLRGRGGTRLPAAVPSVAWGLSPRTRRNPLGKRRCAPMYGSISADAEEPFASRRLQMRSTVYLRGRGGTSTHYLHDLKEQTTDSLSRADRAAESMAISPAAVKRRIFERNVLR